MYGIRQSRELFAINQFMLQKGVDSSLRAKIEEYLQYVHELEQLRVKELETDVIGKLPENLRRELLFQCYGRILLKNTGELECPVV
jgi:hypothetical protein